MQLTLFALLTSALYAPAVLAQTLSGAPTRSLGAVTSPLPRYFFSQPENGIAR
jgi:hypothetical protein